jgi:enhancing lycopene biosynthesis protein 2
MANTDNARGLWPIGHLTGGEIRTERRVLTASATVYQGDILKVVAAGSVEAAAADDGVIVGGVAAEYKVAGASGTTWVDVYVDPNIIFGCQADSGTAVTVAAVNATANHVAGAGSATTQLSGHELDADDIGTGAQLKILGKIETPDNTYAEHVDLAVVFNEHLYKAAVAGV